MPKRVLKGEVISVVGSKTISVRVLRCTMHPLYGKPVKSRKNYKVHVEDENSFKVGDSVSIIESKPISKTKKWSIFTSNSAEACMA